MYYALLLAILVFCAKAYADNSGNCQIDAPIDWINNLYEPEPIQDVDTLERSFDYTGPLAVRIDNNTFISATTSDNKLVLRGTEAFSDLDRYVPKQTGRFLIIVNLEMTCSDGTSRFTYRQAVEDTNNHSPEFGKTLYEYSLPMPMMPRIDYTTLGDFIVATDLDFTNQEVTFTIEPPDFQLSSVDFGDKDYRAVMTVSSISRISGERNYVITATDGGVPPRSSTSSIKITVDSSSSITDIPRFSSPSYTMEYSEDSEGIPSLTFQGDSIKITSDLPEQTHVTGDNDEFFEVVYEASTSEVTVRPRKRIDSATTNVMILTLTARVDGETSDSRSVVVITIPENIVISVPRFSAPFYRARYSTATDPHQVTMETDITVTDNADQVMVVLGQSSYPDNFELIKNEVDFSWSLKLKQNLPDDFLNKGDDIVLTLEATNPAVSGKTLGTLIVSLPVIAPGSLPKFSRTHYTAVYKLDEDGKGTGVELVDGPILVTSEGGDELEVSLIDSFTDNFKIDYSASPQIIITEPLDDNILLEQNDLLLTIKASLKAKPDVITQATVLLKLPLSTAGQAPVFEKPHYTATYMVASDGTVTVELEDGPIATSSDDDSTLKVILVESYTDNFEIDYTNSQQISVKKPLDQEIVSKRNDILLVLKASTDSSTVSDFATVLLQIPAVPAPEFSRTYYNGVYKVNSEGVATVELLDGPVTVTNSAGRLLEITLVETFTDNFRINYRESPQITVSKPLDDTILAAQKEVVLVVEAAFDGASDHGHSVIVLQLPEQTNNVVAPKFNKPSYILTYKIDGSGTATVDLNGETISLTNDLDGSAIVEIVGAKSIRILHPIPERHYQYPHLVSGYILLVSEPSSDYPYCQYFEIFLPMSFVDYKDNFQVERNEETKDLSLNVIKNLDDDILRSEEDILVTLNAKFENSPDGYATLLIKLPDMEAVAHPKFKELHYVATYVLEESTDSIEIKGDSISLEGDNVEGVTVDILGKYADHFELRQDNQNFEIQVKENLESGDLDSNVEIVLDLRASLAGAPSDGFTTVVINLPQKTSSVRFTESYYTANYKKQTEMDKVELTNGPISIVATDNVGEFILSLQGSEARYFETILQEDGTYLLNLKDNLDDTILNKYSEIIVTLEVTVKGFSGKSTAPIIISLPPNSNEVPTPKFADIMYRAVYTIVDNNLDSVRLSDADQKITIVGDDLGTTTITVSQPYTDNFKISFDNNQKAYIISVSKNLDPQVLKDNREILLTLDASAEGAIEHGYANVIVELPAKASDIIPKFKKSYFTAVYRKVDDGDIDSVEITGDPISLISNQAELTDISVTGSFRDNFKAEKIDDSWRIMVIKNLDDTILKSEHEIIVTLEATLAGASETGLATLIVRLPGTGELSPAPRFTQAYYTATYITSDSDSPKVEMTSGRIAILGSRQTEVEVSLVGTYSEYFTLQRSDDEWVLSVRTPLTSAILETETDILLEMDAKLEGAIADGSGALVIKLPTIPSMSVHFDKTFYVADYIINDDATETVEGDSITVNDEEAVISVVGDYSANFDVQCTAAHVCHLTIKNPLDVAVLNTESDVIVVLQASRTGSSDVATATVVVDLPLKDAPRAPQFTKPVYTATYSKAEGGDKVEVDNGPITVIGDDVTGVTCSISGANSEYFSFARNGDDKFWTLTVARNLPSDVLERNNAVILTLNAKLDGVEFLGYSALVVKLPKEVSPTEIYFTDVVYMSEYDRNNDNDELNVQDKVKIEGSSLDQVEISLVGEYQEYFRYNYDAETGEVKVQLKSDLPDKILDKIPVITVTIEANLKGSTSKVAAGLVVQLPLALRGSDDDDDGMDGQTRTVFIAVICVLAALLLCILVGAAFFYYLRIRGRNKYMDMDEYIATENRFTRNPNATDTKKFDHPTRRATGVIRYSISDDMGPRESTTDHEDLDKEKTVAFDETVEEREIDPRDDEDKGTSDVEYHEPIDEKPIGVDNNNFGTNHYENHPNKHHEQRTEL